MNEVAVVIICRHLGKKLLQEVRLAPAAGHTAGPGSARGSRRPSSRGRCPTQTDAPFVPRTRYPLAKPSVQVREKVGFSRGRGEGVCAQRGLDAVGARPPCGRRPLTPAAGSAVRVLVVQVRRVFARGVAGNHDHIRVHFVGLKNLGPVFLSCKCHDK